MICGVIYYNNNKQLYPTIQLLIEMVTRWSQGELYDTKKNAK